MQQADVTNLAQATYGRYAGGRLLLSTQSIKDDHMTVADYAVKYKAPDDLTSFAFDDQWLVTNPKLATFVLLSGAEYQDLCRLLADLTDTAPPNTRTAPDPTFLAKLVMNRILYPPRGEPDVKDRPAQLKQVYYAITEGCNLRCPYCYMSAERRLPDELSTDEAKTMIRQAADMGAELIHFTGGEPLLRRDVYDLADFAKSLGLETGLISNGTPIKSFEKAKRISEVFDRVTISIDGGSPEINDRTRGSGAFKATRGALGLLNQAGVAPRINHVLTEQNADALPILADFLSGYHIKGVRLMHHSPIGRGAEDGEDVTWSTYKKISVFTWESPKSRTMSREGPQRARQGAIQKNCGLGGNEIYVTSQGNIFPCKLITNPVFNAGNVRDKALRDIFESSPVLGRLQNMEVSDRRGCSTCYVRGQCGGGCRAVHLGYTGKIDVNSPDFCKILRNMNVVNMWQTVGQDTADLGGPDSVAFTPRRVMDDARAS